MSEKHYVVSLKKGVDKDQFLNELTTSTSITDIPDRVVDTVNTRPISKRMLEVALTDEEAQKLLKYYYQFFVTRIGSAPYRGSGSSVKKGANNTGNDGMAYRVYGCGIKKEKDPMVVALESVVVLPK